MSFLYPETPEKRPSAPDLTKLAYQYRGAVISVVNVMISIAAERNSKQPPQTIALIDKSYLGTIRSRTMDLYPFVYFDDVNSRENGPNHHLLENLVDEIENKEMESWGPSPDDLIEHSTGNKQHWIVT